MDTWNQLLAGFATAATPINLLWAFVGCALGTAIGVLPGLGPAVTVAMLLPITSQVEPTASMIFFAGIYYGAMYGGSTTSILLNTPGETGTMVTALEGSRHVSARMPEGGMFVMVDVRRTGLSGDEFARRLLDEEKVVTMPGESFGAGGAGHLRIALTVDVEEITEASKRIARLAERV